jgi:hypothetical protein
MGELCFSAYLDGMAQQPWSSVMRALGARPNPSFERTPYSGLRPVPGSARLARWVP